MTRDEYVEELETRMYELVRKTVAKEIVFQERVSAFEDRKARFFLGSFTLGAISYGLVHALMGPKLIHVIEATSKKSKR